MSVKKFETKEYAITEAYQNISIYSVLADITLEPTDGEETKVICKEEETIVHTAFVKDGQLRIRTDDKRKWYQRFGSTREKAEIRVLLPRGNYGALVVKNTTGNVEIPSDFEFETVEISVTTGDTLLEASVTGEVRSRVTTGAVSLSGIRCERLVSTGTTGSLKMKNVIAREKMEIARGCGNVDFEDCDGGELMIKVTTGHVKGTLLTQKAFCANATTGRVNVPESKGTDICRVKTTTGKIQIDLAC